jgi:hypothetical protein
VLLEQVPDSRDYRTNGITLGLSPVLRKSATGRPEKFKGACLPSFVRANQDDDFGRIVRPGVSFDAQKPRGIQRQSRPGPANSAPACQQEGLRVV